MASMIFEDTISRSCPWPWIEAKANTFLRLEQGLNSIPIQVGRRLRPLKNRLKKLVSAFFVIRAVIAVYILWPLSYRPN